MPTAATVQRLISPIPPGRYWLHVIGDLAIADFAAWVRDMSGAVVVETVEEDEPPPLNPTHIPRIAFVIFRVPEGRSPFLNGAEFGFPNFAPPEVRSSQDVERVPEPTSPFPPLPEIGLGAGVIVFLFLLMLLGGNNR